MMMASKKTRMAPRVQLFWCAMLAIYLCFQSFSCGRADRLWRISDVYENSAPVLLKPYGLAQLWYEEAAWLIRPVEDAVLVMMVSLCMAVPFLPYRTLSFLCGAGWLFLHGYEHSLTGGSHTHVLPSLCMMSLALPPREALVSIRWWNLFLLFSAGLSKLFNGVDDVHPWWGWMDGESMRFYFLNSRLPVPEPFYTLTMRWGWFAAAQCTGSVLFELSTCLLFWRPYRLVFPLLATAFHGVIWYTLGVNYLTSVIIQWTLVLDADDWRVLCRLAARGPLAGAGGKATGCGAAADAPARMGVLTGGLVTVATPLIMAVTIVYQVEFWPLTPIPMYSGYRPAAGYNLTHIASRTYLDHLVNEMAPHVWSRRWTDVVITDRGGGGGGGGSFHMHFCAPTAQSHRGMKEACLVPRQLSDFDTERGSQGLLAPPFDEASAPNASDGGFWTNVSRKMLGHPSHLAEKRPPPHGDSRGGRDERRAAPVWFRPMGRNASHRTAMRPGGWGRQKPIVVMAALPGKAHVYCEHATLGPAEDFLYRQCAFLAATVWGAGRALRAELVVHLGTGDLTVGSVECEGHERYGYTAERVPRCVQTPFGHG